VAEPDVLGLGGEVRQHDLRRRTLRQVGEKVVLGEPDRSVTEPIGKLHLLDGLLEQPAHELVVAAILRRELVDQADIH
jgi:hypothetical protein